MSYNSGPEWNWERWQWRSTLHSPKLQNYQSFTILFIIISRIHVGWSYHPPEIQSVCSAAPAEWAISIALIVTFTGSGEHVEIQLFPSNSPKLLINYSKYFIKYRRFLATWLKLSDQICGIRIHLVFNSFQSCWVTNSVNFHVLNNL